MHYIEKGALGSEWLDFNLNDHTHRNQGGCGLKGGIDTSKEGFSENGRVLGSEFSLAWFSSVPRDDFHSIAVKQLESRQYLLNVFIKACTCLCVGILTMLYRQTADLLSSDELTCTEIADIITTKL